VTYFITFSCYGARLHGDERGSVDKNRRLFGGPMVEANTGRFAYAKHKMRGAPYELDAIRRRVVLSSIIETSRYCGWLLLAAHVRTNHVHIVLDAEQTPERVMNKIKAYATRALVQIDRAGTEHWSRHGSTRYLWSPSQIDAAVGYVVSGQGEPLELYIDPGPTAR
jgi:REP element-mobilizing transposase RayT